MGTPTVQLPQPRPLRSKQLKQLTLPLRDFPMLLVFMEELTVCGTAMLVPTTVMLDTYMLDTHMLVPITVMPVTPDGPDTHMPQLSLDTPTVPSSQLNPLMSSLPVPTTWLPMLKKRTI